MTFERFEQKFDTYILPRIEEIHNNNSQIKMKNMNLCKKQIFNRYYDLRNRYKNKIFNKTEDILLDRHKIASCICGAILYVSVFDKTQLIKTIQEDNKPVEAYFYYVNELIAFYAGAIFLGMFLISDNRDDYEKQCDIIENFPVFPETTKSKVDFLYNMLFNLAQVNDNNQIGKERYDMYAYSMIFFLLENYYNIHYTVER